MTPNYSIGRERKVGVKAPSQKRGENVCSAHGCHCGRVCQKARSTSIWSERHGRYVCEKDAYFPQAKAEGANRATINPTFKLVFLSSASGTVLFVLICVVTTIVAGRDIPDALHELIRGLFDLAKIGFGAVVGLLGGQSLRREVGFGPI